MGARTLSVKENILGANAEAAETNRKLLRSRDVRMMNFMSASGSGKTSVILRTIERLRDKYEIAAIEGSVASSIDAEKIIRRNIPAVQINSEGGCHLNARRVREALDELDLDRIDLILLENVGNLACTADFDLGADKNVVILSVPEGDDKPRKYPAMFIEADAVLVNKMDVLPYFDFDLDVFTGTVHALNPEARIFQISAKTGEGMEGWIFWIEETIKAREFHPQQHPI